MEINVSNSDNSNNFVESSEKQRIILSSVYLNKRIQQAKSLGEFYSILDKINANTRAFYQNFFCREACSRCCKKFGSPATYQIEWQNIENHLLKSNFQNIDIVYKNLKQFKDNLRMELESRAKFNLDFIFNQIGCPFLIDEKCSIYTVRPLICRTFGFSLEKHKDDTKITADVIYTCDKEKQRWDEEIAINKYTYLLLPQRSFLISKLAELNVSKNKNPEAKIIIYYLNKYFEKLYE